MINWNTKIIILTILMNSLAVLDSSGAPVTGLLSGNTINLGSYKQCFSTYPKNFSSSYCIIDFKISEKPIFSWVPHNVPILFTLCLPDSCSNQQLETMLEPTASVSNATVAVQCQPKRPGFSIGDIFTMWV